MGRHERRLAAAWAALIVGAIPVAAQQTATWYIGTYANDILVWDEASEEVVDRIRVPHLVPNRIQLSDDMSRLYVGDASGQYMQVVDVASGDVLDEFTLSRDSIRVRIDSFSPHPSGDRMILVVKEYTEHRDRYSIRGPFLLEYDIRAGAVTDTIPWPDGRPRDRGRFRYAPDGRTIYMFGREIVAIDAETYRVTDRWDLSEPLGPGLGRPDFDTTPGTYDVGGTVTSLFRMTDPVQNRDMLGVARVRLDERDVDFFTLGRDEPLTEFVVAPGGEKAYALYTEVGRYEFWEFDLVGERVTRRQPFTGRPRMGLRVSADGDKLYIFVAGNTIDVYDVETFELLHTVSFDEDMRPSVVRPGPAPGR